MSSIKKDFAYTSFLSLSNLLFPLITFPYISRALGPEGLGKVSFISSYAGYFMLLAALGIPSYGVREVAKLKDDSKTLSTFTSELIVLHFISTLFLSFFYFGIAYMSVNYRAYSGFYELGFLHLLANVFLCEWFFQGMGRFKYVTLRSILFKTISMVLFFCYVHRKEDVMIYYGITVFTALLNGLTNIYFLSKNISIERKNLDVKKHIRPVFMLFSISLITSLYTIMDKVILGYLTEDVYVGHYSLSERITKVFLGIIGALGAVSLPRVSKALKEKNDNQFFSLIHNSIQFVITISIPIVFIIIILAKEIILIFSGEAFLPAVFSLRVMCSSILFISLGIIYAVQILIARGKEKFFLYSVIIGAVFNLVGNFLLVPLYQQNGSAFVILLTELLITIIIYYFSKGQVQIKLIFWRKIITTCLVCSGFFIIYRLVFTDHIFYKSITTITISSFYYVAMQLFVIKDKLWKQSEMEIRGKIQTLYAYLLKYINKSIK